MHNKRVIHKKTLAKLIGKLSFLTMAVPYGKLYLSNLYIDLNTIPTWNE